MLWVRILFVGILALFAFVIAFAPILVAIGRAIR